ncbi:hypothetical protein BTA35_0213670 [Oceanospirillum linum]|uniref:Uncharacterized protein n=1 Tax=Oceanospirillum linum TaxID=966 RepID=A0A1T1H9L3_OCELI|nr:hypothetical protein BTA35_0213670 [Oceanospirillum linum]
MLGDLLRDNEGELYAQNGTAQPLKREKGKISENNVNYKKDRPPCSVQAKALRAKEKPDSLRMTGFY